jgi:hypothetical protein
MVWILAFCLMLVVSVKAQERAPSERQAGTEPAGRLLRNQPAMRYSERSTAAT